VNQRIAIINGSPKVATQSVSGTLAAQAVRLFEGLDLQADIIQVRNLTSSEAETSFDAMRRADSLLLVFPLYFFCLPSMLMRFLEDYTGYLSREGRPSPSQKVYALVNCGFPEPDINGEAVRVVKSFAGHIGVTFGGGISLGGGGMFTEAREAPFMRKAIAQLDEALARIAQGTLAVDVSIASPAPRRLYYFMGNLGWRSMARKNGLKKRDLFAQPYQT
jgi:multimeric flavodoxin WrbA